MHPLIPGSKYVKPEEHEVRDTQIVKEYSNPAAETTTQCNTFPF